MALTFFWRCEGTTLDGTHDFTASDNTATANNTPSISATAAKIGSNGLLFDSSADRYDFNPSSIISPALGSLAFWLQVPSGTPTAGDAFFLARGNASSNDNITIELGSGGNDLTLRIRRNLGTNVTLSTTGNGFSAGNWFFVTAQWDQAASDRKIAYYNSSGTLVESVEDTSTAYDQPTALDSANGLRFGDISGWGSTRNGWIDNIFIGSAYADADTFVTKRDITSYTEYEGSPPLDPIRLRWRM